MTLICLSLSIPALADPVRQHCANDYMSYCSHTEPYSKECKRCMRSNLSRLSKVCKQALKLAGYRSEHRR